MSRRTFYGRRYHGKKATKIQRFWRKKKKSRKKKSLQKQLTKLKKTVYDNSQRNWIDTNIPQTSSVSTGAMDFGAFLGLNNINYGTNDHTDRIGDVITLKRATMIFTFDQSTTDSYNYQRVIIGVLPDVPAPLSLPSPTDILEIANVNSFYKKDGAYKWTKLKDFMVKTTLNTNQDCVKRYAVNIDFKGLKCHYRAASNQVIKNMPFMLTISDSGVVDHPKFKTVTRLWFSP